MKQLEVKDGELVLPESFSWHDLDRLMKMDYLVEVTVVDPRRNDVRSKTIRLAKPRPTSPRQPQIKF